MKFYIIIPAHNEEAYLKRTLQSLVDQSLRPKKIVVVNDNSTDNTQNIIDEFSANHEFIESVIIHSKNVNLPGSKVIHAFSAGLETLEQEYDIICKFDADLIFPEDYLQKISTIFQANPDCGMAGGFCYIEKNKDWVIENLTNKDHIRGALKAYTQKCFNSIGGLKKSMGWDTVDEMLARYHGYKIMTDESLKVKHLKSTGKGYSKTSKYMQGEAFYVMRYGFVLSQLAALKLAVKKGSLSYFINTFQGYLQAQRAKTPFIVSKEEGRFIRKLRWRNIKKKIL
jgi:glycosyltransferase involved in cell wall biosynthesis